MEGDALPATYTYGRAVSTNALDNVKAMGRRTWIKIYPEGWLRGSIREETCEVRGVWIDLLTLAGDSAYGDDGMIQLADKVGMTDQTIAGILNLPMDVWQKGKSRLSNHPIPSENRIEIKNLDQGYAIKIINWAKYQSEYQRQKKYRPSYQQSAAKSKKVEKSYSRGYKEKEKEKEKENICLQDGNSLRDICDKKDHRKGKVAHISETMHDMNPPLRRIFERALARSGAGDNRGKHGPKDNTKRAPREAESDAHNASH